MKKIMTGVFIAAFIVLAGTGEAQVRFGGGVQGGVAFSSFNSEVKDFYGTGYGFGAHADLRLVRFLTLRLNGDYHIFPSDKTKFAQLLAQRFTIGGNAADPAATTFDGFNVKIIGITINGLGRLPVSPVFAPYALVGMGIHFISASDPAVSYRGVGDITNDLTRLGILSKPESESDFGINFGAGVEFGLGVATLYLEGKYVLIFSKDQNTAHLPITLGVTF